MINECEGRVTVLTTSTTETATASVSGIAVTGSGAHAIVATYAGDSLYGSSTSGVASLNGETPTVAPTFSVAPGTYTSAQTLALSDTTPGAVIYYTTNGTTPTTGSTPYTVPITVAVTETMQAIAVASGDSQSGVASASYIVVNPIPSVAGLSPAYVGAGSGAFTIKVTGSGFTTGSTVYWGASPLPTQLVNDAQLSAQVSASSVATAGTQVVTVQTPTPGGGTSNQFQFEVDSAEAGNAGTPSFSSTTATVAAGASASYPVTISSSATSVSATCLNLPAGASCSYSSTTDAVTISTSSTTPAGTYQITVVFSETLPGTASAFVILPILLLPLACMRKRLAAKGVLFAASLGMVLLVGAALWTGCGGGGSSSVTPIANPTHPATSSGVVSLTVK